MDVLGIQPDTPSAEIPVNIKGTDFSLEVLSEKLNEISEIDRQKLSKIMQK